MKYIIRINVTFERILQVLVGPLHWGFREWGQCTADDLPIISINYKVGSDNKSTPSLLNILRSAFPANPNVSEIGYRFPKLWKITSNHHCKLFIKERYPQCTCRRPHDWQQAGKETNLPDLECSFSTHFLHSQTLRLISTPRSGHQHVIRINKFISLTSVCMEYKSRNAAACSFGKSVHSF